LWFGAKPSAIVLEAWFNFVGSASEVRAPTAQKAMMRVLSSARLQPQHLEEAGRWWSAGLQLGAVLCGTCACLGQAGGYSLPVPQGASTIANHLHRGSNTIAEVLPNVPPGTRVFKFDTGSGSYYFQEFNPPMGGWVPNPLESLHPGVGAWMLSPAPFTLNFVGTNVPPPPRPRLPAGRYFVSSPTPEPASFEVLMGYPPIVGDRVIQYNGTYPSVPQPTNQASSIHTFGPGGWDVVPTVPFGKSAFVDLAPVPTNSPPQLNPIFTQVLHAGALLQVPVSATDTDQPPNQLTYTLEPGAPAGMSIDPVSGFLLWQTTAGDAGQARTVTVRVTDNGAPPLSDTWSFDIVLDSLPEMLGIQYEPPHVLLTWSAIPGTIYRLLTATNLSGPWFESPQDIVATNTAMTFADQLTTALKEYFYRITTVPTIPTTTTNPWSWGYCLLPKAVFGGPGIAVTPLAPPAGTTTNQSNEAIPFIVNASDLDKVVHLCVCIQPLSICVKGQVIDRLDTLDYKWSLLSGGGDLSADGPATLYQPPSLTNGEQRTITLKVEIPDSRGNDTKATVNYSLELTRLAECSYRRVVTITPEPGPGTPVVVPDACVCVPLPEDWIVDPVLTGDADKTVIVCAGERVILHAHGEDADKLKLACTSANCGAPTSALVLADEMNYAWSAVQGGFPDYGGNPTSNSRRTSVIYKAPDAGGDDTVTVVIKDSGSPAPDAMLTNTISIKAIKVDLQMAGVEAFDEDCLGGLLNRNDDDDDENAAADNSDTAITGTPEQQAKDRADMVSLTLKKLVPDDVPDGKVYLKKISGDGNVRLFKESDNALILTTASATSTTTEAQATALFTTLKAGDETYLMEGVNFGELVLGLEYTDGKVHCLDIIKIKVISVRFSRAETEDAAGNAYGYEEFDTTGDFSDDHVSVKNGSNTFVRVTIAGTTNYDQIFLVSGDAGKVTVSPMQATNASFLLRVSGLADKGETKLQARGFTTLGTICAEMNVNSYKEILVSGKLIRVFKTGDEAGTIAPDVEIADVEAKAKEYLKYPVVKYTISAKSTKGIAFDKNGNGRVDFYNDGNNPEIGQIYTDLAADGIHYTDAVLLKDSFPDVWRIASAVAVGDTNITLTGGAADLNTAEAFTIGSPTGAGAESFRITARAGQVITIDTDSVTPGNQGFVSAHPLGADDAASHAVRSPRDVIGLSSNIAADRPALLVGSTAAVVGQLASHEHMHGQGLSDVNLAGNVMHWVKMAVNPMKPFRFKELVQVITGTPDPKPGSPKDNQWETPTR